MCICHTRARVHVRARARISVPYPLALSGARATLVTAPLCARVPLPIWKSATVRDYRRTRHSSSLSRDVCRLWFYRIEFVPFATPCYSLSISNIYSSLYPPRPPRNFSRSVFSIFHAMFNESSSRTFIIWLSIFLWRAMALYLFLIVQESFYRTFVIFAILKQIVRHEACTIPGNTWCCMRGHWTRPSSFVDAPSVIVQRGKKTGQTHLGSTVNRYRLFWRNCKNIHL